ncbi:MAG: DUF4623 domain-containing protein [Ignavibacteriaceae bacterium]|nr:DUF4623 domain-containing protein [Ignavibacteriaceae bacterium]
MKKILVILFTLIVNINIWADGDTLWVRSAATGNLPTWFSASGNTERGFGFGKVGGSDRVYVVNRNGGLFVRVLDANTGSDVGTLDVTGITGGTFALNDIGVTTDGIIYGANLASGATATFKLYRWTTEASVPTVAFNGIVTGVNKRLGDKITVTGSTADNSARVWLCDATSGNKIFVLGTTDNGNTFAVVDSVILPAATLGNSPAIAYDGSRFYLNSNGKNLTVWSNTWTLLGTIPGSIIGTGSNAMTTIVKNNLAYVISFEYSTGTPATNYGRARMLDVNGNLYGQTRVYTITQNLGTNNNANGTGDVDIRDNGDGTYTIFVLGTNNGLGAYTINFNPIINGRFDEPYIVAANKLNSNLGFGPNINVTRINYYTDANNLYIGVAGDLNTANSDGIGVLFGTSNINGLAAGTNLGGVPGGGHFLGNTGNNNWAMDFEVDYGFALNPGGDDTLVYVDAARFSTGGSISSYLGAGRQDGLAQIGPGSSGVFTANSVTFAFDTAAGVNRGFEIAIPLSELGNPGGSETIQLFAFVVSSTAFFSDVTVPGNVTGGNPGFNPNFNSLSGGPYHSGAQPIPVELVSFAAIPSGNNVTLNWSTATETNNKGFSIERSSDNKSFKEIGFISGFGTSTELREYSFIDNNLAAGKYYYRLKQIDFDGSYKYSNVVEVNVLINPNAFELSQNYPNPFNPTTSIKFSLGKNDVASLKIFNSIGEEVATLFNSPVEAGRVYEVKFDAAKLTSGVYFYQLKQGDRVETKKMILIK